MNPANAFALPRADERHRRSQLRGKRGEIELALALAQVVGKIQDDQRRNAERQDGRGQHQVPAQVGGVEHQQDGIRFGRIGAIAGEHIVRHLFIFRSR